MTTGRPGPPRVSVGLPVYNGERFLSEAMESLLGQTFTDFELIISDNASTDGTAEICRHYAAIDERVSYHRNPVNIGGSRNSEVTMRLARGEFFRLAAYDDLCAPTHLERLVEYLDAHPDADLCHTSVIEIDADGKEIRRQTALHGSGPSRAQRLRDLASHSHGAEMVYGLGRLSAFRAALPPKSYSGSDNPFLAEMALRRPFHVIEEPLFMRRYHEANPHTDPRRQMAWHRPELLQSGRPSLPYWLEAGDYLQRIWRVAMPFGDRVRCHLVVADWMYRRRRQLAGDVVKAVAMLARPKQGRIDWYRHAAPSTPAVTPAPDGGPNTTDG